jgi:hypothetical protein
VAASPPRASGCIGLRTEERFAARDLALSQLLQSGSGVVRGVRIRSRHSGTRAIGQQTVDQLVSVD